MTEVEAAPAIQKYIFFHKIASFYPLPRPDAAALDPSEVVAGPGGWLES
jgi:hypothetical protein